MERELAEARQTFFTECAELLQEIENSLLRLEKTPEDQNTINSLFRAAHTIKGSSGIVGVESVERFTHVVESLLSRVRDGEVGINGGIIELLLECRDHISILVERAGAGENGGPPGEKEEALVARLNALLGCADKADGRKNGETEEAEATEQVHEGEAAERAAGTDLWHISIRFGANALRDGMDPVPFLVYLSRLGEIASIATLHDSMPQAAQMDPESCYLGFEIDFRSDFSKKEIEDVFEFVREDSVIHILPPRSKIGSYVELIGNLPEDSVLLGELLVRGGALTKDELDEALKLQSGFRAATDGLSAPGQSPYIGEIMVNERMVYPELVAAALEKQKKTKEHNASETVTIRIDAAKLDALVNLVGELVISSANVEQHARRLSDGSLVESASHMARLVDEIRDSTMKVRMVPIGDTFSRFNRVVRDIGRDCGKEIALEISGGDTELDKTVIEKINDPLMHLVRNAADHGIEGPEARAAAGKQAMGTIRLNAFHDAGCIVIEISDDGRGLNRTRILEKAHSLGLVANTQTLSDRELLGLIFEPGFSTAEAVTKLSGRGVGMDVVKRNIEALRGTVDVESAEGCGTTVRIRLPLTLAIIDGFMVGVNGSSYVIPLDMVVECVELSDADRQAADKRSYINLRGEVLPYIRLREYFNESGGGARFENVVIVQYAGHKTGLLVDELYGEVQTVVKSLGKMYKGVKGITGATIMGNGRVALILDVPRLIQSIELDMAV